MCKLVLSFIELLNSQLHVHLYSVRRASLGFQQTYGSMFLIKGTSKSSNIPWPATLTVESHVQLPQTGCLAGMQ